MVTATTGGDGVLASIGTFVAGVVAGAAALHLFVNHRKVHMDCDDSNGDSEDIDDDGDDHISKAVQQQSHHVRDNYRDDETYKMLLIFNMELYKMSSKTGEMKAVKMSPGKAAAQSGHATLGAYRRAMRLCPNAVRDWLRIGQMKITVKCPTVSELLELKDRCSAAGLNTYLIRDAGHTEIEPGSQTVLAVGPAPASAMDPLTRHLKPY